MVGLSDDCDGKLGPLCMELILMGRTDLVPARMGHAVDILLVCGASAGYNAVAIAIAVVDARAPVIGDFAVTV